MSKIEDLQKDIQRLSDCVKGIDDEIIVLESSNCPDHFAIAKKVKDLRDVRKLLTKNKEELAAEELKEQNQPNVERQKFEQMTFNKKSNSYSVVRNSYIKPRAD